MILKSVMMPVALICVVGLSACNSSNTRPQQVSAPAPDPSRPRLVSAPGFKLPDGAGCSGAVNRFQALMDNDLETGHTTAAVHAQISSEIKQAAATCAAGNDAGARAQISASRSRHGYPNG